MEKMYFYFNAAIISILVSGIACLIIGVLTLIKNKKKTARGWRLTILGSIIVGAFTAALIKVLYEEYVNHGDFLSASLFFMFFFLPFTFIAVFICIIYFLAIGVTSLQEGFTKNETGKFNVESIVLGFVMLLLGVAVIFSLIMFIGASISYIGETIANAGKNKGYSSSQPSSLTSLSNYLFSIMYK